MKRTYNLDSAVVEAVKEAVSRGLARSQDEFVEDALRRELRLRRDREHESRWAQAAGDSGFLTEVHDIEQAYRTADAETWPST